MIFCINIKQDFIQVYIYIQLRHIISLYLRIQLLLSFQQKTKRTLLKVGTLTEVFTRDIEGNPFEKGFSLDNTYKVSI